GGFDRAVTLTTSGLPSGAVGSFSPSSDRPAFSSTLTIDIPTKTPEGKYTITIQGSGGGKTHSATVILNVEKKPRQATSITISLSSKGNRVTVNGELTPTPLKAEVTLTYKGPNGETILREVPVDSQGRFTDTYIAETPGVWVVSASWLGNEQFEPSQSQERSFMVEKPTLDIAALISNPLYLAILIAAIGGTVAALLSRRRSKVTAPRVSARYCPHCGAAIQPDDEYCNSCGAKTRR
ncbi:MAG: zinc-ribbon domain-containing protein, partial [Candidatus Brockarchaeota archaeon]|nr:zinc-ribbon domain-containing protein [Candidatus Brockarchaeota archaeon]